MAETLDAPPVTVQLAGAIKDMLDTWAAHQRAAKITIEMTEPQWAELLEALNVSIAVNGHADG